MQLGHVFTLANCSMKKLLLAAASVALSVGVLLGSAPAVAGAMVSGFDSYTLVDGSIPSSGLLHYLVDTPLSGDIGFDIRPFDLGISVGPNKSFITEHSVELNIPVTNASSSGSGSNAPWSLSYVFNIFPPILSGGTSAFGGGTITYGTGLYDERAAFGVNWVDMYPAAGTGWNSRARNSYQLIIVDRSQDAGRGYGDIDIIFNYDSIEWAGWSHLAPYILRNVCNTGRICDSRFSINEYTQFRDMALHPYYSLNSDVLGRYIFEVRNPIPEPETYAMLLAGLGIVGTVTRRQRIKAAM